MAEDLFEGVWHCLKANEISDKLNQVQQLLARWHSEKLTLNHESPCHNLERAGLPQKLQLVHPTRVPRRRLGTTEGRIALLHAVAHIEFSAINLAKLEGANLSGAHMRNISAEDCDMRHVNLSNADLSQAVLGGSVLRSANVQNANFAGVELASVTIDFANFSKALNVDMPSFKKNYR